MSQQSEIESKQSLLLKIRERHPDRVPVLIQRREGSSLPLAANQK